MIAAGICLALGFALLTLGPRALPALAGEDRCSPAAGIAAWRAACWLSVTSVLLALALVVEPPMAALDHGPNLFETQLAALGPQTGAAASLTVRALGLTLLAAIVARLLWSAVAVTLANRRRRARHRAILDLVCPASVDGVWIVENPTPLAYAVPGSGGRVVLTTGANAQLDAAQRRAVLAHERAHLRHRHHLAIASAHTLARAFPRVILFAAAAEHTRALVEAHADDIAAARCGPRPLAEALLILADMKTPGGGLGASGTRLAVRLDRLLGPRTAAPDRAAGVRGANVTLAGSVLASVPVTAIVVAHATWCLLHLA